MRRLAALAALCAVGALAWAVPSFGSSARTVPCKPNKTPGLIATNKVRIVVYCGTAKATVRVGGRTYRVTGGMCFRLDNGVNIGVGKLTQTYGAAPKYRAFWLSSEATRDRTIKNAVIRIQLPGRDMSSERNTLVLKQKRSRGTFTGSFAPGGRVTGSFTCS